MKLYLASLSPRRQRILSDLGVRFRLTEPDWHEPPPRPGISPAGHAARNARRKARSAPVQDRRALVIGVDTIVVLGDRILGKPRTRAEAREMLGLLSGRTHKVMSGVAVRSTAAGRSFLRGQTSGRTWSGTETSLVTFRRLSDREISRLAGSDEPLDKAGAYAIQGRAGAFVTRIAGSYLNIVGLPPLLLLRLLARAGYQDPLRHTLYAPRLMSDSG